MKIVVYAANIDGYDLVRKPLVDNVANVDFVYFSNVPLHQTAAKHHGWTVVWPPPGPLPDGFPELSPRKKSRFIHINACRWFQNDYTVAIQHGANIQLVSNPNELIRKHLRKADLALFKHPHRDSVIKEVNACIQFGKVNKATAMEQYRYMRSQGFNDKVGLSACLFMIWRLNDNTAAMQRAWWAEVAKWTAREQLSFDYVRSRHKKVKVRYIPGDPFTSPMLRYSGHGG